MAKIVAEELTVSISRLAGDDDHLESLLNDELIQTLKDVVENLIQEAAVVEIRPQGNEGSQ